MRIYFLSARVHSLAMTNELFQIPKHLTQHALRTLTDFRNLIYFENGQFPDIDLKDFFYWTTSLNYIH